MDNSPNLTLPYIVAAQAQKHVTHNEAIRGLDAIVQLMVLDRDLASPPGSPSEGDRYIVAAGPTGAWDGQAGKVAAWQDDAWAFYAPREGWLAWVADEDKAYVHAGGAWAALVVASLGYTPANKAGDTFSGNVGIDGGTFVFNEAGADLDARMEGDTDANLFFLDASTDRIGIGTNTPGFKLTLMNDGTLSGGTMQLAIQGRTAPTKQLWVGFDTGGNFGFISAAISGSSFNPLVLNRDGSNVGVGTATFGASANKVLSQGAGTAPTTAPADVAQLWVADVNAAAGKAGFHMLAESGTNKLVVAGVLIKTDTGDPAQVHEGLLAINTFDNTAKIYADGAWRTIASGW